MYNLLSNPIYIGEIRHKGTSYPGQHEAIIDLDTWERTTNQLRQHRARSRVRAIGSVASPLIGKVFDEKGEGLTPTHAKKGQRRYRYYVSRSLLKGGGREGWRVPAAELEQSVTLAVRQMLDDRRWLVSAVEASDFEVAQITSLLSLLKTSSAVTGLEACASETRQWSDS